MARAGFEADRTRLVLYERATAKTRELTGDFDNNVGEKRFILAARLFLHSTQVAFFSAASA
jgi:hypothetical protein